MCSTGILFYNVLCRKLFPRRILSRYGTAHIGHGIIGDELYGYVDETLINRQALHAYSLEFNQPRTKEKLKFKASLPKDISELIEKLRK